MSIVSLTISSYSYLANSASGQNEIEIRGSKAILRPGDSMKVTLTTDSPTTMNNISFNAMKLGPSDPFTSSQVPFTIEINENGKIVASESFTWSLDDKFKNVNWEIFNKPKLDEKYKMILRYDIPESHVTNTPIQIDTESIKVNGGEDGIDVHGRIRVLFAGT
ncbi:MAG TPA: hypothetical protein VH415_14805 [Nitrososphaeraceae archaeon]